MHDSGERKEQSTGALSDPSHANAAMELLSPYSLWQLSTWLGKGAEKYAPRNWEKGIPFSVCVGKLMRHLAEYEMGKTDEPHLDAIGFWWHALTHYEAMIALGKLPTSLNDLPQYEKKRNEPEQVGKFTIKKAQDASKGWYIILTREMDYQNNVEKFLHKDLTIHSVTGWIRNQSLYGEAPGYYSNKKQARLYIVAYQEANKPFVCPEGWEIRFYKNTYKEEYQIHDIDFVSEEQYNGGWFVWNYEMQLHLEKDLMLYESTGEQRCQRFGEAPGYWPTKQKAEAALAAYLEKTK